MNIQVNSLSVFSSTFAREGDRHYLDLSLSMSRPQMERAIVTLMGHLTELPRANLAHLLRSEFPEVFTTTESIE